MLRRHRHPKPRHPTLDEHGNVEFDTLRVDDVGAFVVDGHGRVLARREVLRGHDAVMLDGADQVAYRFHAAVRVDLDRAEQAVGMLAERAHVQLVVEVHRHQPPLDAETIHLEQQPVDAVGVALNIGGVREHVASGMGEPAACLVAQHGGHRLLPIAALHAR